MQSISISLLTTCLHVFGNCIDLSDYMLLSLMELNRDRHLHKHCVCRRDSRQLKLRRMTRRCNHPMI